MGPTCCLLILLCVDFARQFAEFHIGHVDRSLKALDLMAGSVCCLIKWAGGAEQAMEEEEVAKMLEDMGDTWLRLVREYIWDQREEVIEIMLCHLCRNASLELSGFIFLMV